MRKSTQISSGELSDETLIAQVARSDRRALETLYDRHAPMVMGISLKITGDRAIAEEVLEEAFWQVWQGATGYPAEDRSFTGWLFKIARSLAIDACQWKSSRK